MKNAGSDRDMQALDLLAERAIAGLDPAGEARLDELLATCDTVADDGSLDRVVAQLDVAWSQTERMPRTLRSRIAAEGHRATAFHVKPAPAADRRPNNIHRLFPWAVAAAASVLAVVLSLQADGEPELGSAAARRGLLATAADVVQPAWSPSEHAGYAEVTGDVVWSRNLQEGYMLLRGLEPNGPEEQYQLWIVAGGQKHPVDGGVFDVPGKGEVVIPIDAKLDVLDAKAFAITLEKRGGVVVSDGPLLIVAAL